MDKVEYTHIAFYNADWDAQLCTSFQEAQNFLKKHYEFDSDANGGFSEESVNGYDYIAEITHKSSYVIEDSKSDYEDEEWPYSDDADTVGHIELVPVKPSVTPERLAEIIVECTQKCLRSPYNKNYEGFMVEVATELLKILRIEEKE